MLSFTCNTCNQDFNIEEEHMMRKQDLKCPNCEAQMADDILALLVEYARLTVEAKLKYQLASDKIENSDEVNDSYKPLWFVHVI